MFCCPVAAFALCPWPTVELYSVNPLKPSNPCLVCSVWSPHKATGLFCRVSERLTVGDCGGTTLDPLCSPGGMVFIRPHPHTPPPPTPAFPFELLLQNWPDIHCNCSPTHWALGSGNRITWERTASSPTPFLSSPSQHSLLRMLSLVIQTRFVGYCPFKTLCSYTCNCLVI